MVNLEDIQRVTPFISPIRLSGGTLYTFNSAAEDLTFSFNNNNNRNFKFSKFALLNIPEIKNSPLENTIKLDAIPGAYNSVHLDNLSNYNKMFSESFQNYCLNLETMLMAKSSYNSQLTQTVSERVFFKWLKELGAIRFATTNISTTDLRPRYKEENESNQYHRVVKYIGEIDYINNYFGQSNSYSEVYVHIPTEVGDFSDVYFSALSDENYKSGMTLARTEDNLNSEVISGRNYDDIHPYGLDITAYYDNPSGLNAIGVETLTTLNFYKKIVGRSVSQNTENDYILNDWWYPSTSNKNTYYTEPDSFNDVTNDDLALYKDMGSSSGMDFETGATRFRRSRLDGISLDFSVDTYAKVNQNVYSLIDIARSEASKDFEFNCVLIYYDIYEKVTPVSTTDIIGYDENGNPLSADYSDGNYDTSGSDINILSTNLFGVLFLDNVESGESLGGGKIPTFKKCRPNSILNLNGNAYGFKINLKLDVASNDSTIKVETVISDSNTLSMDIYAYALNEMRKISEIITTNSLDILQMSSRFYNIEKYANLFNSQNVNSLTNRMSAIEQKLLDENLTMSDVIRSKQEILDLINRNYDKLNEVLSGTISSDLLVNLDIFKQGDGIKIENINNKLLISSSDQNYTYSDKISCSILNDWKTETNYFTYETNLQQGKNYLRISDNSFFTRKNLKLFIRDYATNWVKGQIFRIYFEYPIELKNSFGNFTFSIFTDAKNKLNSSTNYSKNVITIDNSIFEKFNNRPILEIHCIDDVNLEFMVDYL